MSNSQGINWSVFDKAIKDSGSNVFGVSVLSANFDFARECIRRIRELKKDSYIIVGGIHPTVSKDEIDADSIVIGEGEIIFSQLLDRYNRVGKYPGGCDVLRNEERIDLDFLPFADREIFSPVRELPIGRMAEPFSTIIIGRGCPHFCAFCFPAETKLFGKKVRMRSVENVVTELKELETKYGLSSFAIHDDCLTAFPKYCHEFAEAKMKVLPKATFYCQGRADQIVKWPGMFKELYKAGLRIVSVGYESGSNRVLDFLRKGVTVEQNIKAAEILNKIGIDVWCNLMVGIPTETKSEVIETVQMAQKIKRIQPRAILSWASFTPHCGSDLHDYCEEHDLSLIKKSVDYRRYFEPDNPKIKGVDYKFLSWAIGQV